MTDLIPNRAREAESVPILLVGTDHRCAPIALREKVARDTAGCEELLVHLLAREEVSEAYALSTCNRTEIYICPSDPDGAYRAVLELAFRQRAPEIEEQGRLYVKRHGEAAKHMLAVASGLESMILGEPEILGQIKQAAALADATGASGTVLRRLLRTAQAAGGRARAETGISSGAVSLGYAVVELARHIFRDLDGAKALIVGAGETGCTVARNLREKSAMELLISNRDGARAEALQAELDGAQSVPFDQRLEAAVAADVVVASTSSPEPVLTHAGLRAVMERRKGRPLLVVDLGVPRNVEPAARKVANLFLHDIDTLQSLLESNLKRRRAEVPLVEAIVEHELALFYRWLRGLAVEPVVAGLQKRAEAIRRSELAAALENFPAQYHEHLDRLTRSLVRRILHHPSARLRAREGEEALPRLDLVRELFRLDED
jgi:glutamyl-tRNA reductase